MTKNVITIFRDRYQSFKCKKMEKKRKENQGHDLAKMNAVKVAMITNFYRKHGFTCHQMISYLGLHTYASKLEDISNQL